MTTDDERFCRRVFMEMDSEWWTCHQLLKKTGLRLVPYIVAENPFNKAMCLGQWLRYREGQDIGTWRIEKWSGSGRSNRWRVVSTLI